MTIGYRSNCSLLQFLENGEFRRRQMHCRWRWKLSSNGLSSVAADNPFRLEICSFPGSSLIPVEPNRLQRLADKAFAVLEKSFLSHPISKLPKWLTFYQRQRDRYPNHAASYTSDVEALEELAAQLGGARSIERLVMNMNA